MEKRAMKPILFSTPMVWAILAGNKTRTRRVIKPQPNKAGMIAAVTNRGESTELNVHDRGLAPYRPGDILWVRETWTTDCGMLQNVFSGKKLHYCADCKKDTTGLFAPCKWKKRPSIFMPRAAARIFLSMDDVWAERLQDITEEEAMAEGIRAITKDGKLYKYCVMNGDIPLWPWDECPRTAVAAFEKLWNGINGKRNGGIYAWDMNPWVWVNAFTPVTKEDAYGIAT